MGGCLGVETRWAGLRAWVSCWFTYHTIHCCYCCCNFVVNPLESILWVFPQCNHLTMNYERFWVALSKYILIQSLTSNMTYEGSVQLCFRRQCNRQQKFLSTATFHTLMGELSGPLTDTYCSSFYSRASGNSLLLRNFLSLI